MRFLKALFGKNFSQGDGSLVRTPGSNDMAATRTQSAATTPKSKLRARVVVDLKSLPFEVVGESHYQDALEQISGGYARDSQAIVTTATIALDPGNKFDPNAVRVEIDGETVGFLAAAEARRVGRLMKDQGVATATVDSQVRGGWRTN